MCSLELKIFNSYTKDHTSQNNERMLGSWTIAKGKHVGNPQSIFGGLSQKPAAGSVSAS